MTKSTRLLTASRGPYWIADVLAFDGDEGGDGPSGPVANPLRGGNRGAVAYTVRTAQTGSVALQGPVARRLTPTECERLQGLPDDHTLVPYRGRLASDTARYRAIGNGMAVPVLRFIGAGIARVEREGL